MTCLFIARCLFIVQSLKSAFHSQVVNSWLPCRDHQFNGTQHLSQSDAITVYSVCLCLRCRLHWHALVVLTSIDLPPTSLMTNKLHQRPTTFMVILLVLVYITPCICICIELLCYRPAVCNIVLLWKNQRIFGEYLQMVQCSIINGFCIHNCIWIFR